MCLSTVYLDNKNEDSIVLKEASNVIDRGNKVEVQTLFGEKKFVENYFIQEVNLIKNYVILKKK